MLRVFTPIRTFFLLLLAAFLLALWYFGPRLANRTASVNETPQMKACQAAAAAKYPAKMVEVSKTPDGTSHVLVNANAEAYQNELRACMGEQSKP